MPSVFSMAHGSQDFLPSPSPNATSQAGLASSHGVVGAEYLSQSYSLTYLILWKGSVGKAS